LPGSTYFITFRIHKGLMAEPEQRISFNHLLAGDRKFYRLIAAVVMPDHVHVILRPNDGYSLSRIIKKGIKGVSAKLINQIRNTTGTFWQDEYHDRIMRSEDEAIEKARYLMENPLRAGLIKSGEKYPFAVDYLSGEA